MKFFSQRYLQVWRDNRLRPGNQLSPQLLRRTLLDTDILKPEELIAGLEWLVHHGYLAEHGSLLDGYRLTDKGYRLSTQS